MSLRLYFGNDHQRQLTQFRPPLAQPRHEPQLAHDAEDEPNREHDGEVGAAGGDDVSRSAHRHQIRPCQRSRVILPLPR